MKFIIRLFPEISIKSKPVRNRLIRLVRQNIVNVCKHHNIAVNAYAQKLDLLLGDKGLREKLGKAAHERILTHFLWKNKGELFEKMIDD